MNAKELLDQLAELQASQSLLEMKYQEARDAVITPDIRSKLYEIDARLMPKIDKVTEELANLTNQVKTLVITEGATVKGQYLMAVYSRGRVSWNGKLLDGMSKLIPQLNEARTVGEPSVTIRKI